MRENDASDQGHDQMTYSMKIFCARYSENIGDALLAECMESVLSHLLPDMKVKAYDISGRTEYGMFTVVTSKRHLLLAILQRLPYFLRAQVVKRALKAPLVKLARTWTEMLQPTDFVVIGGGNLYHDVDYNFPLKISLLTSISRSRGLPVAVYAVGVGGHWSRAAAERFKEIRNTNLRFVGCRDNPSVENWNRHMRGVLPFDAVLCPDPGLLAESLYGAGRPVRKEGDVVIGLGITHPSVLRHHADMAIAGSAPDYQSFFLDLARGLADRGFKVTFFTNGAREDEVLLDRLIQRLGPQAAQFGRAPRPRIPADLCEVIGSFDGLIAHRLHANIVAYALGRPAVGLSWDVKVASFYSLTGRPDFLFDGANAGSGTTAEDAAELMARAVHEGLDQEKREEILKGARRGLEQLAEAARQSFRQHAMSPE